MEWMSGNIFIRAYENLNSGYIVDEKTHNYDHTSIVINGSIRVDASLPTGEVITKEFSAPSHFLVKKDVTHKITILEDDTTYWCVYSHRDPQGEVVQEKTGIYDAYY